MTTEYLLDREVELVLSALTPDNRLVCQTLLHTGLRLSDVLNLKTEQIKPRFWVTEQKTGKRRLVGLPEPLRDALLRHAGSVYVFPGRGKTGHRTRQAVWKDIKRAAVAFRLPQNVAPHSFRKVYAVDVLKEYGDIEKVKRALNHDSLTTTMIYVMAALSLQSKELKKPARYRSRLR
ncbi:MAG: tyrosine-type recombinase/integrase [Oscillospiraceae bacterium]|nr:tyrosine-type recombinase/integrase [Oscillospiraceae bacterium]